MGKRMRARQAPKKTKAKRGSGNPAKRAEQAAVSAERRAQPVEPGQVPAAFGGGGGGPGPGTGAAGVPEDFELPAALRDLLPPPR
jgi:signal recognition particle subunit SRP54